MNQNFVQTIPILRWKVSLERGPTGFGFGLRGGRDHNLPFYILRVAPTGPASKSGDLRVGDIVEAINQTDTGMYLFRFSNEFLIPTVL